MTHDITTTVKRMENELLSMMQEKIQKYTEAILHLLNVELVIESDGVVSDYVIPGTMIHLTFHPNNDGFGLKLSDRQHFVAVSPTELGLEEGVSLPVESAIMSLNETQIHDILELLRLTLENLEEFVAKRKRELQEKLDIIQNY
ncbi:MAG: hypothetical protein HQM12_04225 [SAR324 cluster bacterium]|nr:hypothetical protein [SAR324 cluster bacterium]